MSCGGTVVCQLKGQHHQEQQGAQADGPMAEEGVPSLNDPFLHKEGLGQAGYGGRGSMEG